MEGDCSVSCTTDGDSQVNSQEAGRGSTQSGASSSFSEPGPPIHTNPVATSPASDGTSPSGGRVSVKPNGPCHRGQAGVIKRLASRNHSLLQCADVDLALDRNISLFITNLESDARFGAIPIQYYAVNLSKAALNVALGRICWDTFSGSG